MDVHHFQSNNRTIVSICFCFLTGRKVWFYVTYLALVINSKLFVREKFAFASLFFNKPDVQSSCMRAHPPNYL